jgi:hypothetical protein
VKRRLTLLLTVITAFLMFAPVMSVEASTPSVPSNSTLSVPGTMSVEWEETTWYYRTYEGYYWKRQWSHTYNEWLTDWIRLAPYPGD